MILGFNHIKLDVASLDASRAFYCDLLGFQRGPAFRDEQGEIVGEYLYISRRVFLEMFQAAGPVTPCDHYCLEVENLTGLLERLRAAGVTTTDVFLGRSKALIASAWDPDGHLIELNEYSRDDSWMRQFLATVDR
jgi:catechol 2,3-dioxygenase-like lactoylglutathione lyase family enzyme